MYVNPNRNRTTNVNVAPKTGNGDQGTVSRGLQNLLPYHLVMQPQARLVQEGGSNPDRQNYEQEQQHLQSGTPFMGARNGYHPIRDQEMASYRDYTG